MPPRKNAFAEPKRRADPGYLLWSKAESKAGRQSERLGTNKYKAKRTEVDGIMFDSKGESMHYSYLKLLERAGEISGLQLQPVFKFFHDGKFLKIRSKGYPAGRTVKYQADFRFNRNGRIVVQDFKGYDTDVSRLKRAMVELFHGVTVEIIIKPGAEPINV